MAMGMDLRHFMGDMQRYISLQIFAYRSHRNAMETGLKVKVMPTL